MGEQSALPSFSNQILMLRNNSNNLPDNSLSAAEDDNTPLYTLNDDDINTPHIEYEENEDEEDQEDIKSLSPLRILFKTLLTPVEGWKALRRADFQTDMFASKCFYPLTAAASVSCVSSVFFEANKSISDWAIDGLITFIAFFFGYFSILLLGDIILPKASKSILKKEVGKQFVMLSLSSLALFDIFFNLVPMLSPVLVFLPIWTIYIIFKGVRVFRVPENVASSTTGLLCLLTIGIPLFWQWLLSLLLINN